MRTFLSSSEKIIVDETILNILFNEENEKLDEIIEMVKSSDRKLCITHTLFEEIKARLSKGSVPSRSFFYFRELFHVEQFDFSMEHLNGEQSIIEYVNICQILHDVFFLTERNYSFGEGSLDKKQVELFTIDQLNGYLKSRNK